MMLFGILLAVIIMILILNFFLLIRKKNTNPANIWQTLKSDIISGLGMIKKTEWKKGSLFNRIRHFLFGFSILLFVIMAVSGLLLPLFWQPTTGLLLLAHVFIAPFFALAVTLSIGLFAHKLQFTSADYQFLQNRQKAQKQKMIFLKKIHFWLFVPAVILNIGSIVCAMYTLFGTSGQDWLINIHRYSALVLLVLTVNYLTLRYSYQKNI